MFYLDISTVNFTRVSIKSGATDMYGGCLGTSGSNVTMEDVNITNVRRGRAGLCGCSAACPLCVGL